MHKDATEHKKRSWTLIKKGSISYKVNKKKLCDFKPKNVIIGSVIVQNKNCYILDPLIRKCPFYMRN